MTSTMAPTMRESSPLSSANSALGLPDSACESRDASAQGQLIPRGGNNDHNGYELQRHGQGAIGKPNNDNKIYPTRGTNTPDKTSKEAPKESSTNAADNQGLLNKIKQKGFLNKGNNTGLGNEIEQDTGIIYIIAGIVIVVGFWGAAAGWFRPSM